jgi:hypothetical protein
MQGLFYYLQKTDICPVLHTFCLLNLLCGVKGLIQLYERMTIDKTKLAIHEKYGQAWNLIHIFAV